MCADAIPHVQTQPRFRSLFLGFDYSSLLAQEVHEFLCEISVQITVSVCILGADLYPAALPMGKILSGVQIFHSYSYQTLEATFIKHPAVLSARICSECQPSPNVSLPITDLESLEKHLDFPFILLPNTGGDFHKAPSCLVC